MYNYYMIKKLIFYLIYGLKFKESDSNCFWQAEDNPVVNA